MFEGNRRPGWTAAVGRGLSRREQDLILPSPGQDDFDLFRARLTAAYYPGVVDSSSHAEEMRGGRLSVQDLNRMTVGFARFDRDALVDPGMIDGYHINVPLAGAVISESGDATVAAEPGTVVIFTPSGRTRLLLWTAGAAQLCLKIDRGLVEEELAALLGRPVSGRVRFAATLSTASGSGQEWSRVMWALVDALDTSQRIQEPVIDYL